ncbi:MAG TPA: hypothetical protein VMO75_04635 [Chthoniobacterales bacterium]|nr:hypothetical protein [Chthoniobacterales bacterium]
MKLKRLRLDLVTFGRQVTGAGPEPVTFGFRVLGPDRRASPQFGFVDIGCIARVVGFGFLVTGGKRLLGKIGLHRAATSTFLRCDA